MVSLHHTDGRVETSNSTDESFVMNSITSVLTEHNVQRFYGHDLVLMTPSLSFVRFRSLFGVFLLLLLLLLSFCFFVSLCVLLLLQLLICVCVCACVRACLRACVPALLRTIWFFIRDSSDIKCIETHLLNINSCTHAPLPLPTLPTLTHTHTCQSAPSLEKRECRM